ncbi:phage late control D family protein [Flexibacterium corallicola]|uniref:phage late control D family protein n=1 Tax=Flexibacterium corallicola TaxID=3037259 RepID=UPI00286EDFB8|nr:contractile injection system protein, VgrG/Pvc8 family [Pseudovibrio sp. M1P-2-3]
MKLAEPYVSLIINGVDVGSDLAPSLLDFTFTDNLHGKADEIAVKLLDASGLWRGPWRPEQGDMVKAAIGYRGGMVMPCGKFQVDIPRASGSRANEVLNFKAVSAFPEAEQRTQRSQGFENSDLQKIIEEIAKRHGYTVSGDIEPIKFNFKRQRRERDLQFIRRIAEDYGYFFSIKDKKLVFFKRDELEKQEPVRTFDIVEGTQVINWDVQEKTHNTYSKAQVSYLDPSSKKLIKGEVQDLAAPSGDTLKIDERVEDEASAKKLAKGRLAKANEDKRTLNITVVGDPLLVAGQVIALGSTYGKFAGNYLTHKATHKLARANYTTKLEAKGV